MKLCLGKLCFAVRGSHPAATYFCVVFGLAALVEAFFYAKNLKQFTDRLVYIPYFILGEPDPENEKTADPEKGRSYQQARKDCPRLQLIGHEGNIFSIAADAGRLLSRNGQRKEADEMYDRVFKAGSYHEALGIISEYVETELSSAGEKKHQRKQKSENTPCR